MQCMTFHGFCCSGALVVVLHSHACISASFWRFLVYINDLLSSGEVADLYMPEDKDGNPNAFFYTAPCESQSGFQGLAT